MRYAPRKDQPRAESCSTMNRDYDIFEKLPDGTVLWRGLIHGRELACIKLNELGNHSKNELVAIHMPTKEIIARANPKDAN